jgi:hypothetical protein
LWEAVELTIAFKTNLKLIIEILPFKLYFGLKDIVFGYYILELMIAGCNYGILAI